MRGAVLEPVVSVDISRLSDRPDRQRWVCSHGLLWNGFAGSNGKPGHGLAVVGAQHLSVTTDKDCDRLVMMLGIGSAHCIPADTKRLGHLHDLLQPWAARVPQPGPNQGRGHRNRLANLLASTSILALRSRSLVVIESSCWAEQRNCPEAGGMGLGIKKMPQFMRNREPPPRTRLPFGDQDRAL